MATFRNYFSVNRIFERERTYTVEQLVLLFRKVNTKITVRFGRKTSLARETYSNYHKNAKNKNSIFHTL